MSDEIDILVKRIAERLDALKLTEREASIAATGKPDALRYIRTRRAMPSGQRMLRIATVLQADPTYLLGESKTNNWHEFKDLGKVLQHATDPAVDKLLHATSGLSDTQEFVRSLAVFQTEEGDEFNYQDLDGKDLVFKSCRVKARIIDFGFKPPRFVHDLDNTIFAYHTTEDALSPVFNKYNRMFIQLDVLPIIGDYAAVILKNEENAQQIIIRRVIGLNDRFVTLHQYAPEATFQLPTGTFASINRVLSYEDMY